MTINDRIEKIAVIGSGTMGSQIAMVSALAGFPTSLVDVSQEALDRAKTQLWSRVDRDVEKGRRIHEQVEEAKGRLMFSTDQHASVVDADYVIEAAIEDVKIKREIFSELDRSAPPHAILATNSSNIMSSQIADATGRPEKVCNLHFFNPVLVMQGVEVVPHEKTSPDTVETTIELTRAFGKEVIELTKEVPGFIANRLLNAIRVEALELFAQRVASFEDIDRAARTALRHPMGPFELMDLVGIDVAYRVRLAEYEQTGEQASLPHPVLKAKFEEGDYGRKTGKGWYDYSGS